MPYEFILTERRGRVGLVTLNRPQALNALNHQLLNEVMDALASFDNDEQTGAMVITGNDNAFAAAPHTKAASNKNPPHMTYNGHSRPFTPHPSPRHTAH